VKIKIKATRMPMFRGVRKRVGMGKGRGKGRGKGTVVLVPLVVPLFRGVVKVVLETEVEVLLGLDTLLSV
jgi:hypothetical protein